MYLSCASFTQFARTYCAFETQFNIVQFGSPESPILQVTRPKFGTHFLYLPSSCNSALADRRDGKSRIFALRRFVHLRYFLTLRSLTSDAHNLSPLHFLGTRLRIYWCLSAKTEDSLYLSQYSDEIRTGQIEAMIWTLNVARISNTIPSQRFSPQYNKPRFTPIQ